MEKDDEIRRLKKENRDLKKKLYKLEASSLGENDNSDEKHYSSQNYFSFLFSKIKQNKFFPTLRKYFRNSLWITRIFRWGLLIYQYLQAGAFVLLYTALFILIIPIILTFGALVLILALFLRGDNARLLFKELGRNIVFVIPKNKTNFDKNSLKSIASSHKESSVLIVSPFFMKKSGIAEKEKMYICYRKEYGNVFIMRNYFFFYFRRRLKKEQLYNIEEIYID
ncbi:MAG: hypothetical protein IJC81_02230 [Clostridia bacterium]|nr:hypothetical protein [Clostridia bacterium]